MDAQPDMQVVGEAADGHEAVSVVYRTKPDIVLMDVQMPGQNGIDATREIMRDSSTRVIILTTFDVPEYVYEGIRAGAVGYLLKDASPTQLIEGIRAVSRGEALYRTAAAADALSRALGEQVQSTTGSGLPYTPQDMQLNEPLTDRELEVLQQMAYGLRNEQIAHMLHISEGTVKTHVHRILQKMGVDDRTQAVVLAIRNKWVK